MNNYLCVLGIPAVSFKQLLLPFWNTMTFKNEGLCYVRYVTCVTLRGTFFKTSTEYSNRCICILIMHLHDAWFIYMMYQQYQEVFFVIECAFFVIFGLQGPQHVKILKYPNFSSKCVPNPILLFYFIICKCSTQKYPKLTKFEGNFHFSVTCVTHEDTHKL